MKDNEETIVLNFKDYTALIDKDLEGVNISSNHTELINNDECGVETVNMTFSKKEILTIANCIDISSAIFQVGTKEVNISSDFDVFINEVDKGIKISAQEIREITKYFIESEGIMNESNTTQDIYNSIINSNDNKPAGEIVKPIETVGQPPKKIRSLYDTVIDTIKNDTKGEK